MQTRMIKINLIGATNTGKTALLLKFVKNEFPEVFIPTIGIEFGVKSIDLDKEKIKLQIWDLGGQECFRSITLNYYKSVYCFLLFVDLSANDSLEELSKHYYDFKKYAPSSAEIQVIASKEDLKDNWGAYKNKFEKFCQKTGLNYTYVSAKNNFKVEEAFRAPLKRYLAQNPLQVPQNNFELELTDEEVQQLAAFKMIYTAIKQGESPIQFYKNNLVKELEKSGMSDRRQFEEIKAYAKNYSSSRTYAAWTLASNPSYYNNLDYSNQKLVSAIYLESFKRGHGITRSQVTEHSIFRNETLEKSLKENAISLEKIAERNNSGEGRLGRICKSFSSRK